MTVAWDFVASLFECLLKKIALCDNFSWWFVSQTRYIISLDANACPSTPQRLKQESIYTYISNVLIICNPFKRIPLYTEAMINLYRTRNRNELPPHVFALAEDTYRSMVQVLFSSVCTSRPLDVITTIYARDGVFCRRRRIIASS